MYESLRDMLTSYVMNPSAKVSTVLKARSKVGDGRRAIARHMAYICAPFAIFSMRPLTVQRNTANCHMLVNLPVLLLKDEWNCTLGRCFSVQVSRRCTDLHPACEE